MRDEINIEEMLRRDAQNAPEPAAVEIARLNPLIAREATRLRHRKRKRMESLIMAVAAIPVAILLILGSIAMWYGDMRLVYAMAISAGTLSLMALLTLPLMEKFMPDTRRV